VDARAIGPGHQEEPVARYGTEHKAATRQRIIDKAGERFKQDGIDGSGIATLMSDAGLTNGAFYAHFASKDELVATVVSHELAVQIERYGALEPGRAGLEAFIRWYLSPEHRDQRGTGCPSAALLDEIGRCEDEARQAYTEGARTIVEEIAARLAPADPASARGTAIGLFTMLVGSLQLARALADPTFSDEVLAQGVDNALSLMD
jgi:AcrR family transcriptional regulator